MASRRIMFLLFALATLFALVMALIPNPPAIPDEPNDKVQHVTAFVTLTVLAIAAFPRVSVWRVVVTLIAFGGLIELIQLIPALQRDSDWYDWYADIGGIIGAAAVTLGLRALLHMARS